VNRILGGLEAALRPTFVVRGRSLPAFQLFGVLGYALAVATGLAITLLRDLSFGTTSALIVLSSTTFFGLAFATKLLTGEERLTFYHHELAILVGTWLLLRALGRPPMPYLDLTALAVGSLLCFGRVGCLFVGCCHGAPHALGLRYGARHVDGGFPRCLVGIRLFPVQLVEASWVLGTVLGGWYLVLQSAREGAVIAWYSCAYGLGRFGFEFFRGDAARAYFRGLSEAQWTTVCVMAGTALAELSGWLPLERWHVGAALLVAAVATYVAATDRAARRLFSAAHVRQLAELVHRLDDASTEAGELHMGGTGLGMRVSASRLQAPPGALLLAFSLKGAPLDEVSAKKIARLLAHVSGRSASEAGAGASGVCRVVLGSRDAHA
jgi:hypothetical protein